MARSKKKAVTAAKVPLAYIGGGRFIIGVPARDIEVDPDEAERLVATGLYEPAGERPAASPEGQIEVTAPDAVEPLAPVGE